MRNPIPKNSLFATPDSIEALQDYVSQFSEGELRAAIVIMVMTMNLCHKIVEEKFFNNSVDTGTE
jgi:hypothetical protein